jgi:hypothetical protein
MASFDKGYALVVGVANYPEFPTLPATVLKDATGISTLLMDATQCGDPPDQVRHLLDEDQPLTPFAQSYTGWPNGPGKTIRLYSFFRDIVLPCSFWSHYSLINNVFEL